MRGFTLVELTVVLALAGMLMLGITVLYLTAQRTWLETSSKLLTQQEATLVLNAMGNMVRNAHDFRWAAADSSAVILQRCDVGHSDASHQDYARIYRSTDSLVRLDRLLPPVQNGLPLGNVKVTRLRFAGSPGLSNKLRVTSLRARDPDYGQTVELSGEFVMQNFTLAPPAP